LIERAAERLEKLAQQALDEKPTEQEAAAGGDPTHLEPTLRTPERLVKAIERGAERQEPFLSASERGARSRSLGAQPAKDVRRHDLDLGRLGAEGFLTPEAPTTKLANEFRVIKRPLIANVKGKSAGSVKRANLIMVTSALPGEGKSFTAINLAISIAMELDSTVLLVDGDVAEPSLSRMLRLAPGQGLIELLTERRLTVGDVLIKTNVPKLSIIPAGVPHRRNTELLASEGMTLLLDEMAERYPDRIIVFDSPPLLPTTESRVLATHMGQVIVVVEAERTTHRQLAEAMATIESCPVVMTVLNKATQSDVGTYYGHYAH
jgi:receptor protein-tyrosine kinase